jgi:rod shape-determining protein MreD
MKKFAFFLLVCGLFLLQISPLLPFADYGIRPDIVLVLTVFFGIQFPLCSGALFVFALGCLVEVFSGVNNGLYPIIYLSIFIGIRSLEKFFDFSQSFNLFLLTASALIVKFFFLLFCFNFIYEFRHFAILEPFLKESAYTLLVFPAVFPLLRRLYIKPKDDLALKDAVLTHEHRHS